MIDDAGTAAIPAWFFEDEPSPSSSQPAALVGLTGRSLAAPVGVPQPGAPPVVRSPRSRLLVPPTTTVVPVPPPQLVAAHAHPSLAAPTPSVPEAARPPLPPPVAHAAMPVVAQPSTPVASTFDLPMPHEVRLPTFAAPDPAASIPVVGPPPTAVAPAAVVSAPVVALARPSLPSVPLTAPTPAVVTVPTLAPRLPPVNRPKVAPPPSEPSRPSVPGPPGAVEERSAPRLLPIAAPPTAPKAPRTRRRLVRVLAVLVVLGAAGGGSFVWVVRHRAGSVHASAETDTLGTASVQTTTTDATTSTEPVATEPVATEPSTTAPSTTAPPTTAPATTAPTTFPTLPPETLPPMPVETAPPDTTPAVASPPPLDLPSALPPAVLVSAPIPGTLPDVSFPRPQMQSANFSDAIEFVGLVDGTAKVSSSQLIVQVNYDPAVAHIAVVTDDVFDGVSSSEAYLTGDDIYEQDEAGAPWTRHRRDWSPDPVDAPGFLDMYQDIVSADIRVAAQNVMVSGEIYGDIPVTTYTFDVPLTAVATSVVDPSAAAMLSPDLAMGHMTVSVDGLGLVRLTDLQLNVAAWSNLLTLTGDESVTIPVHTRREVIGTSDQPLPLALPTAAGEPGDGSA